MNSEIEKILELNKILRHTNIKKDIIIYGAGNFGRKCAEVLQDKGHNILYFVDKNSQLNTIDSIQVIHLDSTLLTDEVKSKADCILGIYNAYVDLNLIEKELLSYNFHSVINPLKFYNLYPLELGYNYWLADLNSYDEFRPRILKSYNLLADDYSRELFKNILAYRFSCDLKVIQMPQNVTTQYFPDDINCIYPPLDFLDCGAYDGDTILGIIKNKLELNSFVAFEPDLTNINLLAKNLQKENIIGYIYPSGVWNETTQLKFNGGTGSSSCLNEDGEDMINVVKIDDVLINNSINFIKMDIEGAETQALLGAQQLIESNKPILAISAYHKFDDLWTIIETINSFNIDYNYYMRMYEYNGFGIVYYAIPLEYNISKY